MKRTIDAEDGWIEFERWQMMWKAGRPVKQVRLLADNNVPQPLISHLRSKKVRVETLAELRREGHADESIYQLAARLDRVLLTTDADLWHDRKHPLQGCPGILFLDVPKEQLDAAARALGRCRWWFFRRVDADWWRGTKVRTTGNSLVCRRRNDAGQVEQWEFQDPERGRSRYRQSPPRRGAGDTRT